MLVRLAIVSVAFPYHVLTCLLSCPPPTSGLPSLAGAASFRAGSLLRRLLLPALPTWKSSGLSSSSENLGVNMPRSTTPALLFAIRLSAFSCCLPLLRRRRLPGHFP